jgi:hypothetical protein
MPPQGRPTPFLSRLFKYIANGPDSYTSHLIDVMMGALHRAHQAWGISRRKKRPCRCGRLSVQRHLYDLEDHEADCDHEIAAQRAHPYACRNRQVR